MIALPAGLGLIRPAVAGVTDPFWSYVVALLHFDGADGSTAFTDETGKAWTPSGSAQIDTAQWKFGGASGLFDGTDVISTPNHAGFNFGSGDFTVELWVRPSDVTGFKNLVRKSTGSDYAPFTIALDGNKVRSRCSNTGTGWAVDQTSTAAVSAGAWNHIALVRHGTSFTQYVNGVASGSTTNTGSLDTNSSGLYIGAQSDSTAGLNGHIDELRVTKGVARYTADFTPPSAPFPDS